MTMDSNELQELIDSIEEPTEPEKQPRPIEDLIKLDSFQDMTDEEITRVMNYRATIAAKDAVFAEKMDIQRQEMEARAQSYKDSAAFADSLLYSLVESELPLQTVPQNVELIDE